MKQDYIWSFCLDCGDSKTEWKCWFRIPFMWLNHQFISLETYTESLDSGNVFDHPQFVSELGSWWATFEHWGHSSGCWEFPTLKFSINTNWEKKKTVARKEIIFCFCRVLWCRNGKMNIDWRMVSSVVHK